MRFFDAIPTRFGEEVEFSMYECLAVYGQGVVVLACGALAGVLVAYLPAIIRLLYGIIYIIVGRLFLLITGGEAASTYYFSLAIDVQELISYTHNYAGYLIAGLFYGMILAFLRRLYGHRMPPLRRKFEYQPGGVFWEWLSKRNYHAIFAFLTGPILLAHFLNRVRDIEGKTFWFLSLFLFVGPVIDFFWQWFHNWLIFDLGSLLDHRFINKALKRYLRRELGGHTSEWETGLDKWEISFDKKKGHVLVAADLTEEEQTEVKVTLCLMPQIRRVILEGGNPGRRSG